MYSSAILGLDSGLRGLDSFTTRPLYPRGKSPRYTLNRRLSGLQSHYISLNFSANSNILVSLYNSRLNLINFETVGTVRFVFFN
jgi:hypothetical protein